MTDRARVTLKTFCMVLLYSRLNSYRDFFWGGGGEAGAEGISKTILNACSVIYKELKR